MDGTLVRTLLRCALLALVVWLVGCSNFDPQPRHLPYSLYDSPLVAGGHPDSHIRRLQGETAQAGGGSSNAPESTGGGESKSPSGTADGASRSDESDRPALSSERSSDNSTPASTSDETLSHEEASKQTPPPASKTDTATDTATAHGEAARYATAIYELNGVALPESTHRNIPKLYRHCRESDATFQAREPAAGDLAFFHNVADANDDGRNNDWYTYVALVESVGGSGTVTLLGYRDGKVRKFRMNLSNPDDQTLSGGDVANTKLRPEQPDDPPYTQYLAGQLFAGYCELLGDKSELLVVDNWQPGMDLQPPK